MTIAASRNPNKRWARSWRALTHLDQCPEGATGPALERAGFNAITLDQLVADGFAWTVLRTFANPKGLTVAHYHITDVGRAALVEFNQGHVRSATIKQGDRT